jgi:hypothetical protein
VQEKRDFSLRKPTDSQERIGKKKGRLAPFEMTVWGVGEGRKVGLLRSIPQNHPGCKKRK